MKAAQITKYGGKDVLQVTADAPKPSAKSGQVLVEVHAAGVNPFDVSVREGLARQMAELDFPSTAGGDFAGIVAAIGEGVEDVSKGQAVYGQASPLSGQGSFAEYVLVKASQLAPKPESINFLKAAALPLASVSAYQALVDHMNLQKSQKILIHGGAGGIGSLAIQLATHLGAYIATTVATQDMGFAKDLGADEVIDYKTQDFSSIIKDYDAVFDTVGGETKEKSYGVLKSGGALVSMVGPGDDQLIKKHQIKYTAQFTQVTSKRLTAITKLVDEGTLKPIIDKIFPLNQAAEALEYLKTGGPKGKVVLEVKA